MKDTSDYIAEAQKPEERGVALDEVRKALCTYFAKRVEDDMDALWDSGEWSEEKNKSILKEHLRTPRRCSL